MRIICKKPSELLNSIKDLEIKMVDLRFADILGTAQHFTIPIKFFTEDVFTEGLGFDGSSICGFKEIHESDMIIIPDVTSA